MAEEGMKYPLVSFYFEVEFFLPDEKQIKIPFQEVGGLKAEIEFESAFKEGGQNRYKHNLPIGFNYDDLTLKRGLYAAPTEVRKWCLDAIDNFEFRPISLKVSLLKPNEEDGGKPAPVMTWQVVHAIPKSISFSEFKSQNSEIVIESMVLSYNYFDIVQD